MAIILFEGGLGLRVAEVRGVGHVTRNLIIVGTIVTMQDGDVVNFLFSV